MKYKLLRQIIMLSRLALYGVVVNCLALSVLLASDTEAQTVQSVKDVKVYLDLKNSSVVDLFAAIEQQTDFHFSYNLEDIRKEVRISQRYSRASVAEILMDVSKIADLKFKQINQNINVSPAKSDSHNEVKLEIIIQTRAVSGQVTAMDTGEPLPGVNIIEKGTTNGTVSDIEGNYTLSVPEGATLVFSSVGYSTQEVAIGSRSVIDVNMTADIQQLQELVVVGYGTVERKDLTGSIGSVDDQTITERGVTNAIQSLQGSVAGVQISNSTGRIGDQFDVVIRGKGSLTGDANPLYVVDGVVTENIDFLNPQDIAKIDILKDASSAAIYGSRGSRGVVIIQTKGGSNVPDGTTVSFDTYYGVRSPARLPEMMSPEKWRYYHMSAYLATINPDVTDTPDEYYNVVLPESNNRVLRQRFENLDAFDWYDAVLKDGFQTNNHLSIASRNENSAYTLGFGYQKETGNIDNESLEKYTLRTSVDQALGDRFKTGGALSVSFSNLQRGSAVAMREAFRLNPFLSPWAIDENDNEIVGELFDLPGKLTDPNGVTVADKTSTFNPLLEIANSSDETRAWNGIGTAYLQYDVLDWLSIRSALSAGLESYRRGWAWGARTNQGASNNNKPSSELEYLENFNYAWDNQIDINRSFRDHTFSFLALQSIFVDRVEVSNLSSLEQPFDTEFYNIGSGARSSFNMGNNFLKHQLASYALRLNYSYKDRYLLTLSNRWDGSSLLSEGRKWSAFPSAAVAWRMSDEPFLANSEAISNLKLRVSYGFTGNNNVDPYSTVNILNTLMYYDFLGNAANGYIASVLANKELTWEKTSEINIGVDFALINSRIGGSIDWYNRQSNDLLLDQELPLESGYSVIRANAASVRNTGIEASLTTVNLQTNKIRWETIFTFGQNKNEIESLYGQSEVDDVGNGWFIGESVDAHYNYKFDGIWQAEEADLAESYNQTEGQAKVVDVNDDGQITPDDDRIILGSSDPSWSGGIISRLYIGAFDFNFTLHTKQGVFVYSNFHGNFEDMRDRGRQKLDVPHWYIPENDLGIEPQRSNLYPQPRNGGVYWREEGVGYYKDASYVKINNISLGYTLPQSFLERINIDQLRIYVNVLNPFVFTDYTGWDPEWAEASYDVGRVSSITTQVGMSLKF